MSNAIERKPSLDNDQNFRTGLLGKVDFEMLLAIYKDFQPQDTENQRFLDLLHGLYILEYRNAKLWYDLNPIVRDLLVEEGLL